MGKKKKTKRLMNGTREPNKDNTLRQVERGVWERRDKQEKVAVDGEERRVLTRSRSEVQKCSKVLETLFTAGGGGDQANKAVKIEIRLSLREKN